MPRKTIKSLEQISQQKTQAYTALTDRFNIVRSDLHLRDAEVARLKELCASLERDKRWLQQLAQNASEALNAFMRNR